MPATARASWRTLFGAPALPPLTLPLPRASGAGFAGAAAAGLSGAGAGFGAGAAARLLGREATAFAAGLVAVRDFAAGTGVRFVARAGALFLAVPLFTLAEPVLRGRLTAGLAFLFAAADDLVLVGIIPPVLIKKTADYISEHQTIKQPVRAGRPVLPVPIADPDAPRRLS